jgi:hypothetical protein
MERSLSGWDFSSDDTGSMHSVNVLLHVLIPLTDEPQSIGSGITLWSSSQSLDNGGSNRLLTGLTVVGCMYESFKSFKSLFNDEFKSLTVVLASTLVPATGADPINIITGGTRIGGGTTKFVDSELQSKYKIFIQSLMASQSANLGWYDEEFTGISSSVVNCPSVSSLISALTGLSPERKIIVYMYLAYYSSKMHITKEIYTW